MQKELFLQFKEDKKTTAFARALELEANGYKELGFPGEHSFDLLYNYLIANYIMKTKESQELRKSFFYHEISRVEVHRGENKLLYSLLRKAGFFEAVEEVKQN